MILEVAYTTLHVYYRLSMTQVYAAASCEDGDVDLVRGRSPNEGSVQICVYGEWRSVCDDDWSDAAASVVCRMHGYPAEGINTQTRHCVGRVGYNYNYITQHPSTSLIFVSGLSL